MDHERDADNEVEIRFLLPFTVPAQPRTPQRQSSRVDFAEGSPAAEAVWSALPQVISMVGVKQDDGVVGHLRLVQRLDDITHVLVHV